MAIQSPIRGPSTLRQTLLKSQIADLPSTPTRGLSGIYGSPSSLRIDEGALVFEIGARHLRAGFSGERRPRCNIDFDPIRHRRVGDYRQFEEDFDSKWKQRSYDKEYGEDYELWRMDVRDLDLGLMEDKLARGIKEAFVKYLLMDYKNRRLVLVLPPLLPLPILSILLTLFFNDYQCSSITLYPTPVLNTVAAGLRSALVVDIGWSETIITAVSELREVLSVRTTRAMKKLNKETGRFLAQQLRKAHEWHEAEDEGEEDESNDNFADEISFEETEECMNRVVWCCTREESILLRDRKLLGTTRSKHSTRKAGSTAILKDQQPGPPLTKIRGTETDFHIPLKSTSPQTTLNISFDRLAIPTEVALFPDVEHPDDHELPIHQLVYEALRNLPLDVRAECTSRVVFTGGGAKIPGLKDRILEELSHLVSSSGWQSVKGRGFDEMKNHLQERSQNRIAKSGHEKKSEIDLQLSPDQSHSIATADLPQEQDPVVERIEKERTRSSKPSLKATIRAVETFGAWTGGSMVSGTKTVGTAVIEKEKFLLHGIAGATRDVESSSVTQRTGNAQTGTRTQNQDKSSWSLGSYWM